MSDYIDDVISTNDSVDIDSDNGVEVADHDVNSGDNGGEVADFGNDNGSDNNSPEAAAPGDMSDDEFEEYLERIESGLITDDDTDNFNASSEGTEEAERKAESESIPNEPEQSEPFRTFATQAEYQAEIDRIAAKRNKDYHQTKATMDDLANELMDFYGVDDRDTAIQRFKNQMNQRKADERGLTVEEFTEQSETERKAKAYDKLETERARVQEVRSRLFAEADQIKQSDSEFDLQSVYDTDATFKADLDSTGSVYFAYANKIKRDAAKKQTAVPQPKQQKQRAFKEGALSSSASGRVNTSTADLSDDEFEKYLKNIMNE